MVSTVLASVLSSYLGKYLELADTTISVGSEIRLNNVSLKESALSDLGLPVKCVHGRVKKLVIKIPWFNLFTKKTTIDMDGLHLLVVPSTAVKYNEHKERKEKNEAKQKRLEIAEQAKQMEKEKKKESHPDEDTDTFAERLVANIIRNLEVTIRNVHLRYEDKQTSSGRYPFACGVTLESVLMNTTLDEGEKQDGKAKLKVFKKHVELNSFSVYWRPKANMYSEDSKTRDDAIDIMFNTNIGTREKPVTRLKYLLGPISSTASLQWCPNPALFDYKIPEIDLSIDMEELCLSLTKYQYQDFVMLLQSFEFISRAAMFRKYKARHGLENLPNYNNRLKDLWKFAFDCVYEEDVMRRINNWSWEHMKEHAAKCKQYRELYKKKLSSSKITEDLKKQLRYFEDALDEVNIRIQRQLAEREVDQIAKEKAAKTSDGGGFWSWFTGGSKKGDEKESTGEIEKNIQKFEEALTPEEKTELYEALDYQENAHHGIFPKSFVARKLQFELKCLTITLKDDDLNDAEIMKLKLATVTSHMAQRPSADYILFDVKMKKLSVLGYQKKGSPAPMIVATRKGARDSNLLNFAFENNPPSKKNVDLDEDQGSLYDQRLFFVSSPLEIVYDSRTFNRLIHIFKTPDDLNLSNLQQTAASKLKEYRAATTLTLQYVIENHNLVDVDVEIMSSFVIIPHKGTLDDTCACAVANLGSIRITSKPISAETRNLKDMSLTDLTNTFKKSLREQAYDKFNVSLENMQVIVSLPNEEWRSHLEKDSSPLFLLQPTSIKVEMQFCLIKNDPEMALMKINGSLKEISINISDYRLIMLAKILDSLLDKEEDEQQSLQRTDSDESMQSALSSLPNTGSFVQTTNAASVQDIVPEKHPSREEATVYHQVTKLVVDFSIHNVKLALTQQSKKSPNNDELLFDFTIWNMEAKAMLRTFDIKGNFQIGGITCEHKRVLTPFGKPVKMLKTQMSKTKKETLLQITYTDVNRNSPDFTTVHDSTLRRLEVLLNTVYISLHQDAIIDLIEKVTKFINEVSSNAKQLLASTGTKESDDQKLEHLVNEAVAQGEDEPDPESHDDEETVPLRKHEKKNLKRRQSILTSANLARWAFRAKKKVSLKQQEIDLKITASLKSVEFDFMTTKVHFANLQVRNLAATYTQTKSEKLITAKLVDFKVIDPVNYYSKENKDDKNTLYEIIAESMDKKLFDAQVTLFEITPEEKAESAEVVDVKVVAKMGRVKVVFLMKFLNDFLTFLEPFSDAKDAVSERANQALEGATKSMIDAYANATRAKLDIHMEAPIIIIPVHSKSNTTFIADLGTLSLENRFSIEGSNIFDEMQLNMNNLQLSRVKIQKDSSSNEIMGSCPIVYPINFELHIKRNMNGARKPDDPAEIKATGTLYEISAELSKNDYDTMLAILMNNFSERGSFEITRSNEKGTSDKANLSLPLKHSHKSGGSRISLSSQSSQRLQKALKVPERDPKSRAVEFYFNFRGFEASLYSGETPLEKPNESRSPDSALAKIQVKLISVNGCLFVDSSIAAKAFLENFLLVDNRHHSEADSSKRITRLMEAKRNESDKQSRMIDIDYKKDDSGEQNVSITVYSFILVGSVPYLLEIANFFVQDKENKYEWELSQREAPVEIPAKMSVNVLIEEPDIFLVEKIEDIDTDSLMLNTKLQFQFVSFKDQMSMVASLSNIRCHTCRFNPEHREETLAQILQPCTLSFSVSQNEGHGMRVNANLSDVCLNVSPHSIFIIQNSVQAFIDSLSGGERSVNNAPESVEDRKKLWDVKHFEPDSFWFLKPEEGHDVAQSLGDNSVSSSGRSETDDEQAIVNISNLIIKVESGLGNNTVPLLLIESSFSCDVRNWSSSRMSLIGTTSFEMAYYNTKLALWEPVIEPVCQVKPDGNTVKKRWDMNVCLQRNDANEFGSALTSPSMDEVDGFLCAELMPPLMSITFKSTDILEMTVTKSFLGVLNTLAESFSSVTSSTKKALPVAPYIVKNETGKDLTIILDSAKGFKFFEKNDKPGRINQLELPYGNEVDLFLFRDRSQEKNEYIGPLQEQTEQAEAALKVKVKGEKGVFELPVSKADKRFFPFPFRGDEMGDHHGMVSEITVDNGCKFITLRTIIQIKNHFDNPVNIYVCDGDSKYIKLTRLEHDASFNVPIKHVYNNPYEFSFQVDNPDINMGFKSFNWHDLINDPDHSEIIECTRKNSNEASVFLNVKGSKEEILWEKSGKRNAVAYVIDIRPTLVLKNCLPVTLYYNSTFKNQSQSEEIEFNKNVDPGRSAHLQGVILGKTAIGMKIFEFRNTDWQSIQIFEECMPELSTIRFTSTDRSKSGLKLDLSINTTESQGTKVISIYSPFWMINKTGKNLTYRGQDQENVIYHPVELSDVPVMFSYTARGFLGKRKTTLKIEDSAWSDSFTLDTIEDAGKVTCKASTSGSSKKRAFSVGININMSKSSLTKIITFTPYYIILNTAEFDISVREIQGEDDFMNVPSGTCVPFWPQHGATQMIACVTGTRQVTPTFPMQAGPPSLLRLGNKYGAIHVETRVSNSECLLTLSSYSRGQAPVQLVNDTSNVMIEFCEQGVNSKQKIGPSETILYTWINPAGPRKLVWSISGYKDEFTNALISDGEGLIELDPDKYLAWVSFLDGMQRILLFTEDPSLCYKLAHSTGEFERIDQEIEVSIHGIGISVVNNSPSCSYELLYTSITSSDIVWEVRRSGKTRYKPLTRAQVDALEADFQFYMRERSVGKRPIDTRIVKVFQSKDIVVNYQESKITQPFEGKIRRQFQKGLWLQLRTSQHQRQLHAKINRIQIDNQLSHCLFPVIMAPVPLPKSVVAESIPKPFIELSVLEFMSPERTTMRQFKYVHALVQELHIKIDQGMLNALMDLFEEEELLDENIKEFLKEDLALASKALKDIAKLQVTKGVKDFYDYIHFSPLKVHVSFSLTSYTSSSKINATRRSNFISLILQSLGVTITDTDDVIFRLAYFERKHNFYSTSDLMSEMTRHYASQAIKQAYVIIFGLDVIGNPFGLVVGVSRSVEDLFYEPFQGAVEGPSEFAEGLAIGVRSVFSGVVGGAAGTFSRITGALGKGLASLTFDDKFQSKRRETIKKRGRQTLGESFARSGKGLVMGIFDGVTGVATKPIEGAKEEGFGGFFKGFGKGMAGLVARPTGGIIDFASGTFDSVKRATDVSEEVERIRPTRFLHPDGVVRNYNLKEAAGNKILKELEKGKYADSDNYVTHVDTSTSTERKSALLITSRRLIYVSYAQMMGNWIIDWEFEFSAIQGPPPVGKDAAEDESGRDIWYIIFKPKEEKKKMLGIFGGSEKGKKVFMPSREVAQNIARTVEELRTSQN